MDIVCPGMRDRRVAASDETVSVRGAESRVYRRGSHARDHGAQGAAFDRFPGDIRTIILHQTSGASFVTGPSARRVPGVSTDGQISSRSRIDQIAAHFVVLQSGVIFYTHDVQFIIDSAGGRRGIDIEIAGRFPSRATPDPTRRLPVAAIRAARGLITALKQQLPEITSIHPHGQVQSVDTVRVDGQRVAMACGGPGHENPCDKLASCPGPDIWVNVGQWACQTLSLSSSPQAPHQDNGIHAAQANAAYDQGVT
jgi:hypothetical protein